MFIKTLELLCHHDVWDAFYRISSFNNFSPVFHPKYHYCSVNAPMPFHSSEILGHIKDFETQGTISLLIEQSQMSWWHKIHQIKLSFYCKIWTINIHTAKFTLNSLKEYEYSINGINLCDLFITFCVIHDIWDHTGQRYNIPNA